MRSLLRARGAFLVRRRGPCVIGLGAADDQLAAHELLVVQFRHGPAGLVDGQHRDKREALGLLRILVADDFGVLHLADPVEQVEQVALRGVEREVADVDFRRADFDDFRLVGRAGRGRALETAMAVLRRLPVLPVGGSGGLARGAGGLWFACEQAGQLLPETDLGGRLRLSWDAAARWR